MFSLNSPLRFWLMLALVIASFGTLAKSQTISGTIVGTVTDQQGGILAGVGVTATNAETALTYQGVTDTSRGLFVIPEVPPGLYQVRAQFSGFQPQEHDSVRVDVNRVTEEDFVLKISASTTVIVVQSVAPMTDINTPTQGDNFNQFADSRTAHPIARRQQPCLVSAGGGERSNLQFCQHARALCCQWLLGPI